MEKFPLTSPFTKGTLTPLSAGTFTKRGAVTAIMSPMFPDPLLIPETMSEAFVRQLAKQFNGQVVTIHGEWTFVADKPEEEE